MCRPTPSPLGRCGPFPIGCSAAEGSSAAPSRSSGGSAISVAALLAGRPVLARVDKTVIAVAPVGEASREAIEAVLPEIRKAFGVETILAPRVAMPASAYEPARRQTLSTAILDVLAAAKRPEWERLLGVADVDLYVPDLNFVFGEADSRRGVAVFS